MSSLAPRSSDVLVVGGGPAGLTAALLAARGGRSVTLLEASDHLGGMAASPTVGGQRVDLGSHRLHPSASPQARALIDGLLGDDLQIRQRNGRMRLADRWLGFPLQPREMVRTLPPAMAARIGRDLLLGSVRTEPADASYADVVRARLGPTVLAAFHGPYARKLWGRDPHDLAGDLARRRIALTGLADVVRRLRRTAAPSGRTFLYPRLGYGQIVDRLAEAAADAGADLRTGQRPTVLRPDPSSPSVETRSGSVEAGRVLWTAPPTALLHAAGGDAATTDGVDHRAVALVYLVLDQPRWLPFDAHYVADLDVPFVRLSEPKNYRDGPDPADVTVLCAEVPCSRGDATWHAVDEQLAADVLDGIGRLDLPPPQPAATHVIRLPQVYPRYATEDVPALAALLRRAERVPGVTLLGRQGLAVADNLHHVIDMAHAAVVCLDGPDGWDAARWAHARRQIDANVIED